MKKQSITSHKKFKKRIIKIVSEFIDSVPDDISITLEQKIHTSEDLKEKYSFDFRLKESELIAPRVIGKTLIIRQGITDEYYRHSD